MNDQGRDTVQTRWGWTVHAGCEGKFEKEGYNRRVMQNAQTREETSFGLLSFFSYFVFRWETLRSVVCVKGVRVQRKVEDTQ